MEDHETEKCHSSSKEEVTQVKDDVEVENISLIPNCCSLACGSDCHISNLCPQSTERLLSNGDDSKCISFCVDEQHAEELPVQLRELSIQSREEPTEVMKGYMAAEEVPSDQSCFSENVDSCLETQVITSNDTMVIPTEKEDNITLEKNGANGKQESMNENSQHIAKIAQSGVTQERAFNVETLDWSTEVENNIRAIANERSPLISEGKPHFVNDEESEVCTFCSQKSSVIKSKSFSVAPEELEMEVEQNPAIRELKCEACTPKFKVTKEMPQANCENEYRNSGKRITSERPASRVSNKSNSSSENSETKRKCKKEITVESDPAILSRRQKQIDYGKNTLGYQRYKEMIPKERRTRQDPQTPPKSVKYSRRAWDGLIKTWRRKLHNWDPPKSDSSDDEVYSLVSSSSFPTSEESENLVDNPVSLSAEEESLMNDTESNGVNA